MTYNDTPLVRLHGASRRFNGTTALSDIDLALRRGESAALVGHNGSGKSTLLRLIGGLLPLSRGKREYLGQGPIGYVPDRFPKLKFTSREYLTHMGRIQRKPEAELKARIVQLHELFRLSVSDRQDMRHYSKGMLQKVNLMQALLTPPAVLLLDEPLAGLDAATQDELVAILRRLKQDGVTLAAATHEPEFADLLADRVVTLAQGRIVSDQERSRATAHDSAQPDMLIRCRAPEEMLRPLGRHAGVLEYEVNGEAGCFRLEERLSDAFLASAIKHGVSIREVTSVITRHARSQDNREPRVATSPASTSSHEAPESSAATAARQSVNERSRSFP
ncbi:ABC transporter ATP-binding protein [Paenibacillus aurantiacus]|uniref:ABC transporter ATP-binding protein n=1 Tax=Paenibacillus aurantiacus TaxID=1936118 RepID=A0ABV5KYN5_9BACL